jgi:hypothetical protein
VFATQLMLLGAIVGYTARRVDADPAEATDDAGAPPDATPARVLRLTVSMGLVAAAVFALVSSRGADYLGFGAGLALGPYVAIILASLGDAISTSKVRLGTSPSAPEVGLLAPIGIALAGCLLLGTLTVLNWNSAYRDEIPAALTTMVTSGPQAGLLTTASIARDSEALWAAMQRLTKRGTLVFAYHGLPAAYLYTSGTPASQVLWTANWDAMGAPELSRGTIAEISRPGHQPDIIVQNLGFPSLWVLSFQAASGYDPKRDALEAFVEKGYLEVAHGERWRILGRAGRI